MVGEWEAADKLRWDIPTGCNKNSTLGTLQGVRVVAQRVSAVSLLRCFQDQTGSHPELSGLFLELTLDWGGNQTRELPRSFPPWVIWWSYYLGTRSTFNDTGTKSLLSSFSTEVNSVKWILQNIQNDLNSWHYAMLEGSAGEKIHGNAVIKSILVLH